MTTSGAPTNARGEVAYPAPGAFPTDDLTPRETSHNAPILDGYSPDSQHHGPNKLRKRDDPRNLDNHNTQQFTQSSSRGHKHVDSGVHIPDTDTPESTTMPAFATSPTKDTRHGNTGNSSKPGVMTGVYSRLPTHGHGHDNGSTTTTNTTTGGVPIFANSPISSSNATTGTNTRDYDHTTAQHPQTTGGHNHGAAAGLAGATAVAGGAAASHAATSRDHHPTTGTQAQGVGATALAPHQEDKLLEQKEAEAEERERNLVRNGRDRSSVSRKDPYWGDVPFGTGVYNGVSGHGSDETPHKGTLGSATQHYPHDGQGPHEGLQQQQQHVGDGASHEASSKPAHIAYADQPQQQQRAFPLTDHQGRSAGGLGQTGTEKPVPGQEHQQRDSRFSEGLAGAGVGAGAAAGAGYVASRLGDEKQQTRHSDGHEGSGRKSGFEDSSSHGLVGGLPHRDHKDHNVKQHKEMHEKDVSPYEGSKAQDMDAKKGKGHSKEAAAAAAAATAAYATHDKKSEEAQHDEGSEKKESKLHALFHRSHHKDKTEQPTKDVGTAGNKSSTTTSPTSSTKPQEHAHDSHHNKNVAGGEARAARRDPFVAAGYPDHDPSSASPTSIYPTSDKLPKQTVNENRVDHPEHAAQHRDSNSKLGLGAAGVAAGAGAGYLAHRQHEPSTSTSTSSARGTTTDPHSADVSPKSSSTNAGAALNPTTNTTVPSSHAQKAAASSTPRTAADSSTSTDAAQPHYKTLASGTPSGIAVDGDHTFSSFSSSPATNTTTRAHESGAGSDHKGYRYAAGAGALGAAGAVAHEKGRAGEEEQGQGQKVVTHRCKRCGEENDISGYFRGE
ncbi:hypothetical protein F4775DRAFT_187156 [Biscogniauxia sp. FL1348]|nr:hypothetical protein F4775DRAFT_187156 [Biscogniauxia sp. FL1348]